MTVLTYTTLGDVPEGLRDTAKEQEDGSITVKVAPQTKLDEFRENNLKVVKERDELVQKFSRYENVTGVNIDEMDKLDDFAKALESLRDTKSKVEAGKLVENSSLEEAAQARVTEVTQNYQAQLRDAAKERDAYKEQVTKLKSGNNNMRIENAIRLASSDPDVGMLEKAVDMILPQAFTVFRVEDDGALVPKMPDGTIIYGSDGVNPMTLKEWLLKQRETNDFLFKGSKGGGAAGASDKIAGRISQAELLKMSPQQQINYARKHGLM